jgi:hypothetical protein
MATPHATPDLTTMQDSPMVKELRAAWPEIDAKARVALRCYEVLACASHIESLSHYESLSLYGTIKMKKGAAV